MLERSGRCLPVLLPLLFSAVAGSSVRAGGLCPEFLAGRDPVSGAGSLLTSSRLLDAAARDGGCPLASFAGSLLAPSHETSSSYIEHLPAAPKFALMVLAGSLCIFLVRHRGTWFAVATSLLSCGHHWLMLVPQSFRYHRTRKHPERGSPRHEAVPPLRSEPACSLGRRVSCLLALSAHDKKSSDDSSAIASRCSALGRLLPGLPLHADPFTPLGSQLVFAQMARGPPIGR